MGPEIEISAKTFLALESCAQGNGSDAAVMVDGDCLS